MGSQRFEQKRLVFAQFATDLAGLSSCKRAQVGAVVFPRDFSEILAIGYNGPPAGLSNDRCNGLPGRCGCIHAEANAIAKLSTRDRDLVMLCTTSPCIQCAGLIINCGRIAVVDFITEYRDVYGLTTLRDAGIVIAQVEVPK